MRFVLVILFITMCCCSYAQKHTIEDVFLNIPFGADLQATDRYLDSTQKFTKVHVFDPHRTIYFITTRIPVPNSADSTFFVKYESRTIVEGKPVDTCNSSTSALRLMYKTNKLAQQDYTRVLRFMKNIAFANFITPKIEYTTKRKYGYDYRRYKGQVCNYFEVIQARDAILIIYR